MQRLMIGGAAVGVMAAGLAGGVPVAQAGTFKTTAKWKSCDTKRAGIKVRATFNDPARYDGSGRYMVKKWVEWEYLSGGRWWEKDRRYVETNWLRIDNTNYDFVSTIGATVYWRNYYENNWRAKVTFKLIKNRKGPRDKKVDEIQIFPTKGSFAEQGTFCGGGSSG